jgi:hypothetical protein
VNVQSENVIVEDKHGKLQWTHLSLLNNQHRGMTVTDASQDDLLTKLL